MAVNVAGSAAKRVGQTGHAGYLVPWKFAFLNTLCSVQRYYTGPKYISIIQVLKPNVMLHLVHIENFLLILN